ncbi:MAG: ATP-binding protein [Rhizobiales bacterium]|nr:ATP-binding protein [Hyphomicrobiales bacterium]
MHHYILGKSGTGKSTYLEHLALSDESGFLFLDKHGQSAERIADTIPCIYWEPARDAIGFNPLKDSLIGQRHLVAEEVIASFKAIWADSWGPRLEHILRNTLLLLLDNGGSIIDIPSVLNGVVLEFWRKEYDALEKKRRDEVIASVLNKAGAFATNPVLSRILTRNTLKLWRVMDKRQRLVVNLSGLGDGPAFLLGALIMAGVSQAAARRSEIPEADRVPFTVYADEFQNYATETFEGVLSEARKWKISLVLAHQFTGQVHPRLLKAVLGNCQQLTIFRVSAQDARELADEMGREDLADTPNFHAWHRTGQFTQAHALPPVPVLPRQGKIEANRRRARASYGAA